MHKQITLLLVVLLGSTLTQAQVPWAPVTTPPWTAFPNQLRTVSNLQLPAAGVVWGQMFESQSAGNFQNYVFTTLNEGQTWQTEYLGGGNADPAGSGTIITDVWALDGSRAWALLQNAQTRQSRLVRTTTGIAGFVPGSAPTATFMRFVRFFDAVTGVLIRWDPNMSDKQVYRTTDGGATWQGPQTLPVPNTDQVLNCVRLDDHLWLGTRLGWVLHSADRGLTWSAAAVGASSPPQLLSFRNDRNGVILTSSGQVLRTADGGTTWAPVTTSGPIHRADLTAVPGSTGSYISVGQPGGNDQIGSSISTDDGTTWRPLETSTAHSQLAITATGRAWTASPARGLLNRFTGAALGSKQAQSQPLLGLYPNPASDVVWLPASAQLREVAFYDATGRLRQRVWLRPGMDKLDVQALSPGLYQVVALEPDGRQFHGRLVLRQP
ncbi:hypothetical protein LJY25_16610 [Hymenobacter sp. BT175]|uniref:YCF48-related protein n=1 Tax=Hymenobacter translucens TaxID=2886507 RepID=UPI001D0F3F28|nr:YCF48-related protein [Hymenobacter translucens]MCC2548073.1 hypothetical protein [Hymenobacter translucens]